MRALVALLLSLPIAAHAQVTPRADAYTDSAKATTNFGAAVTLGVVSSGPSIQKSYFQFDLSSIPAGYTGSNIAKATLKLYVNSVTTAGSFNVDYVTAPWVEKTITSNLSPSLGTTVVGSVPLTTASVHNYILIDVTPAVVAWLNGTQANDGLALVANSPLSATFDSKESTTQSHPAELDIVFTGAISGIATAAGSGLTGGGTTGTLNLGLTKSCSANQVLQWNGSTWACASVASGTITGVTAGADLTGGGASGSVTLNVDPTKVPLLASPNTFTANQTVNGLVTATNVFGTSLSAASANPSATTISGFASAATGQAWGVEGATQSSDPAAYGVFGHAISSTGSPIGVYGKADSTAGVGTFGQNGNMSVTGQSLVGVAAGVWGDGGTTGNRGVIGTADGSYAGEFISGGGGITLYAQSNDSNTFPLYAYNIAANKGCSINTTGDFSCSGTKNAVVPIYGGKRKVAMSAIESPENWFEDFGSAQLVNGVAVVRLDPDFIETVNTEKEYRVFPVPNGDCKGLYVTNKAANSFEVHELGGGTSNVRFDYRITAIRKNYETVRFADHTNDPDPANMMQARTKNQAAQSHDPVKK